MRDAAPRRRWQPLMVAWVAAVLLLWVGSVVAVRDDARGTTALSVLEPLVGGLVAAGASWAARSSVLTPAVAVIAAALLLSVAWRRRHESGTATALAATAVAVLAMATVLRLYALDRLIDAFDGELTGYCAAATRLAGIPLANEGGDGSWAPLGLTFYPPCVVAIHAAGTTVLALRLAASGAVPAARRAAMVRGAAALRPPCHRAGRAAQPVHAHRRAGGVELGA